MPMSKASAPPGPLGPDLDRCDEPLAVTPLQSRRAALMRIDAVTPLADIFKTLGDPTRVRILDAIARGELCVCDVAALLGTSESAVSHQLRILRSLRLVRARRAGRHVYYALDDQHIVTLFQQAMRHVQEPRASTAPGDPPPEARESDRARQGRGGRAANGAPPAEAAAASAREEG